MPRAALKLAKIVQLAADEAGDAEFVERFLRGDSAALEMIVRRHGTTVLGVCRRILGANADADDAFQATFLTLSLRARTIRKPAALNAWLHGVALRCCRKAIGRRACKPIGDMASTTDPFAEVSWRELRGLLDEELNRLPAKLRSPLILCHLEGRTRDEAAKLLRWSLRTFDRRLARGRELLKARLVRRGVATLGLGVSVLSGNGLTAGVLERLVEAICGVKAIVSPSVRSLIAPASTSFPFKLAMSVVLVLGGLAAVSGFGGSPTAEMNVDQPISNFELADSLEEPMPEGALRRFGSTRFRHPSGPMHAAMSSDGKMVAIGGFGVVIVYDTATGKRIRTFDNCYMTWEVGRLPAIAFSPDGKLLAHIDQHSQHVAHVWNVETGKKVSSVSGLRPSLSSINEYSAMTGFSPGVQRYHDNYTGLHFLADGRHIAVVGEKRVIIRNVFTDANVAQHDSPTIEVDNKRVPLTMIAFSPDGMLYAGNYGAEWQVGEWTTGKVLFRTNMKPIVKKEGESRPPFAAISPDNKLIAIPMENRDEVGLWDIDGKRLVRTLVCKTTTIKMKDHLSFSTDGKQLFAGGDDIVYRWDVATGKALPSLEGITSFAPPRTFTDAVGKSLVTVDRCGMIRRWDPATGKQLESPHGYTPCTITDFSSDGAHVVINDQGGRIDLWTIADNKRHELYPATSPRALDVRFSPSGKLLAAGFDDGSVRIWNTATRNEIKWLQAFPIGEKSAANGIEWSPDESCVYAASRGHGVTAWDWRNEKRHWHASTTQAWHVRASRDGKLVAALRSGAQEILILDAQSGKIQSTARLNANPNYNTPPNCMVFSRDGRTLISAQYDGSIHFWDTATGKQRWPYIATGPNPIWAIDLSRDGRHLVTGNADSRVRVWELDTHKEVLCRADPLSSSFRVKFASDGRSVMSAQQRAPILWSVVPTSNGDRTQWFIDLMLDPATAYRAQWSLADSKGLANFLREKIGPKVAVADAERMALLFADLDASSFRARETAVQELVRLGRLAEPAVRAALTKSTSLEQRRRLEGLIARFDQASAVGVVMEELRVRRAVQALTWSSDPDTRKLLMEWASGMDGAPLTEAAKAALEVKD